MTRFIDSTVALMAIHDKSGLTKLTRVSYYHTLDNFIRLVPENGHNTMEQRPGAVKIDPDVFAGRPSDPYDDIAEARWALNLCGYSLPPDH